MRHSKETKAKQREILRRKSREGKPKKDRSEIARRKLPMKDRYR